MFAEVRVEETNELVIEDELPDQNGVCPQNGTGNGIPFTFHIIDKYPRIKYD